MSHVISNEERESVYNYMITRNNKNYNTLKLIEELSELATILTQSLTKGAEPEKIIEEIGDVKMRLKVVEARYSKELIQGRIDFKLKKNLKYLKQEKYKDI